MSVYYDIKRMDSQFLQVSTFSESQLLALVTTEQWRISEIELEAMVYHGRSYDHSAKVIKMEILLIDFLGTNLSYYQFQILKSYISSLIWGLKLAESPTA